MLSIKKDLRETTSANMSFDPDWYVIDNEELEYKIMRGFPNIEFVLDESGAVVDVTYTVQPPMTLPEQVQSLTEENQLLTDCILEMSEIIYGGE